MSWRRESSALALLRMIPTAAVLVKFMPTLRYTVSNPRSAGATITDLGGRATKIEHRTSIRIRSTGTAFFNRSQKAGSNYVKKIDCWHCNNYSCDPTYFGSKRMLISIVKVLVRKRKGEGVKWVLI